MMNKKESETFLAMYTRLKDSQSALIDYLERLKRHEPETIFGFGDYVVKQNKELLHYVSTTSFNFYK